MIENAVADATGNTLYQSGNIVQTGGTQRSYTVAMTSLTSPQPFPSITVTPTADLVTTVQGAVGAFPRDEMDTRLTGYLSTSVDLKPRAWTNRGGVNFRDALTTLSAVTAPTDGDNDGMPDTWEAAHGLSASVAGSAATTLSSNPLNGIAGCTTGYTDLECYLNELADSLP